MPICLVIALVLNGCGRVPTIQKTRINENNQFQGRIRIALASASVISGDILRGEVIEEEFEPIEDQVKGEVYAVKSGKKKWLWIIGSAVALGVIITAISIAASGGGGNGGNGEAPPTTDMPDDTMPPDETIRSF